MPTTLPHVAAFDLETCAPPGMDARDANQAIPVQGALVLVQPAGSPPPAGDKPLLARGTVRSAATDATLAGFGVDIHTPAGFPALCNPGCPINPEAAEVHGIRDEDVANAQPEADFTASLRDNLAQAANLEYVLVAANAHYDLTVLDRRARHHHGRGHLSTLGTTLSDITYRLRAPLLVFDPMVIDRWADKYRRGKRTLSDLCAFYRVPLTNAHDAGADAEAAALVLARIFAVANALENPEHADPDSDAYAIAEQVTTANRFRQLAQMSATELHEAQITWRAEWAQGFQEWLRTKAPADRRDPDAVVDGSWPILPLPAPAQA